MALHHLTAVVRVTIGTVIFIGLLLCLQFLPVLMVNSMRFRALATTVWRVSAAESVWNIIFPQRSRFLLTGAIVWDRS